MGPSVSDLRERLAGLTLRDEHRLGRRLRQARSGEGRAELERQIARAEAVIGARVAALPRITYPPLPVSERRDEIAAAIRDHQVVVVAGETGSGKTTQLPKICLELGRGIRGTIGHTQPRRLAARTVAQRIADELGTPLGDAVGYAVRFTDQVSERTLVKLMTDGILLAEIQRDRQLLRYDTIIVDEAHERSLNIDFLLGYLTELLPRRPDLKVIVTSATIDPQRFASHFGNGTPIVEVSGRTYPVEIRYRPLVADLPESTDEDPDGDLAAPEPRDQVQGIVEAVAELSAEGPGDVLVFLSGEREIRDTAETLRGLELQNTEVLPLYARLSTAEQHRVFEPHTGRRVVLATNVAETSLTVPGIRYVIDPGTARISRYSARTKVQRLPIEPISQASALQRSGRCGRTSAGIAIRLYSARDFDARPQFTEPEILRTNLASVILQLAALGLGELEHFPFVEPPDRRSVQDGRQLLRELGAFDVDGRLTPVGRQLAQLPVDPRIARMIIEAQREGCVREVLILAAALSIPDPRERPSDQRSAADQKHARFADEHSDFAGYLKLWSYLGEQRRELSGNAFRRLCREEFLHYLRIREWQDLRGQLRSIARSLDIVESEQEATPAQIHGALLAGLLSHVGVRVGDGREYQGARNARFVLAPGSAIGRRPPRWVVAAELVETSRLFARVAARVDPEQIERHAEHLVVRSYSEPHWDGKRATTMAYERVTLYGLPLVPRRRVTYSSLDRAVSRDLFIRHALVEGDWQTRHWFFHRNRELLAEVAQIEERARRRDLIVGDEELFAFYDKRIPADVVSGQHFDVWWKRTRKVQPDLLTMTREDLVTEPDAAAGRPDSWTDGDLVLPVRYRFEPGADDDGVTVRVPIDVLARLGATEFGWQVPALREELVTALIRALPKELRRNFVPVPDTARAVLAGLTPGQEPLLDALQRELHRRTGVLVPRDAFDLTRVPAHLRVTFAVENEQHEVIAQGKDLAALQVELAAPVQQAVAAATGLERRGLTAWPVDLPELPRQVESNRGDHLVVGYPALVDCGSTVDVRVFPGEAKQAAAMPAGARRLLRLVLPTGHRGLTLSARARLLGLGAVLDDCADAAVDALVSANGGAAWSREAFERLRQDVAADLPRLLAETVTAAEAVLVAAQEARAALPDRPTPAQRPAVEDIQAQLAALLRTGFVSHTGVDRLRDLRRYLQAISRRLAKLPTEADLDHARMQRVRSVEEAYRELVSALPPARATAADMRAIEWQLQELRVSLFAQQLGTRGSVSEQRIFHALDTIAP